MATCKKCGKTLKVTNEVLSVKSGSMAEKNGLTKGDCVVSIDEQSVKNKNDIDVATKDKTNCKININHNGQTKTITVDNPHEFINGIVFSDEKVCSSCGTKQKGNKLPLIIGIIGAIIAAIVIVLVIPKKEKITTSDINIGENNASFSEEKVGADNIDKMKETDLSVDVNGNKVSITASGSLSETEKAKNIDAMNQQLIETNNDSYEFLDFDDSTPLFAIEKVGADNYRKMYSKNDKFDIRKPVINGYNFNNLSQERLADIGQSKKEILGTIYFDYGYANWPKTAVVQVQKTTLGKIDFNKTRYTETVSALKSLLTEIPQGALQNTLFYIDGHTDHTSPHDFNQTLSEARADCIKEILIKNFGINEKNIVTKGYSWDRMAVNTMEECPENRRVELSVVFFN